MLLRYFLSYLIIIRVSAVQIRPPLPKLVCNIRYLDYVWLPDALEFGCLGDKLGDKRQSKEFEAVPKALT
jgi:hypothetical protein